MGQVEPVNQKQLHILLVEDSPVQALVLRRMLEKAFFGGYRLSQAGQLSEAIAFLHRERVDLVLCDLWLPDSYGFDTFYRVHQESPETPIIVLTSLDDEAIALNAVREGAQDYLFKGQVDPLQLTRCIQYAIARHEVLVELRNQVLKDELTDLYNRRGFLMLAEHSAQMARRLGRSAQLVFLDLDGLKQINDTYGHTEGDSALVEFAEILRQTFRNSDIAARLGGDEFAVLMVVDGVSADGMPTMRLQHGLDYANATRQRPYRLSASMGVITFDPERTLEAQLAEADAVMYAQKRAQKRTRTPANGSES
ncbi:MAG: diguanylate cyclase [Armatimonadetes bacterium]|nr:diguanylate cyclase [Armatimonadota bacterium]